MSPAGPLLTLLIGFAFFPALALAQGVITNGADHLGSISRPGELDLWTFTATEGDGILLAVAEVGTDTAFAPWIRLRGPNGVQVAASQGNLTGRVELSAPAAGTYTVVVASGDPDGQATGDYVLTLARSPDAFVVPAGDEGGQIANGANHTGTIRRGDLDAWTFTAAQGDFLTLSIAETGTDSAFVPWIRLRGPEGFDVAQGRGNLVGRIERYAPATGTYTVVVASADPGREASGNYVLNLAGASVPSLNATWLPASFTFSIGSTTSQTGTLRITSASSGAPLSFTAAVVNSPNAPILTLAASSGTTPTDISVTLNPNGAQPGAPPPQVVLTSGGAANSPYASAVPVTIEPCTITLVPPASTLPWVGGQGTVPVGVTGSSCPWAATTATPWVFLSNSAGVGAGTLSFAVSPNLTPQQRFGTITVAGNPVTVTQAAGVLTHEAYVRQLYRDLLNREADPGGLSYWLNELNTGRLTLESLAERFFSSPEFAGNSLYVVKLYLALLDRNPDFPGWQYHVARLVAGGLRNDVLASFIASPEFLATYGPLNNEQFVDRIYLNVLGRAADPDGRAFYVGRLNAGVTRAEVTQNFVSSPEHDQRVRARALANLLYLGFLRRLGDAAGVTAWTNYLATQSTLDGVRAFVYSAEYLRRFDPVGQPANVTDEESHLDRFSPDLLGTLPVLAEDVAETPALDLRQVTSGLLPEGAPAVTLRFRRGARPVALTNLERVELRNPDGGAPVDLTSLFAIDARGQVTLTNASEFWSRLAGRPAQVELAIVAGDAAGAPYVNTVTFTVARPASRAGSLALPADAPVPLP